MSDPTQAPAEQAAAVRRGAGLFALESRGVLEVRGGDAPRWLNGMISGDVAALAPGSEASGCYATLLTPQGRIVADLHVLLRPEGYWLDLERAAAADVLARLDRYVIADDVALRDRSDELTRFSVEGPRAADVLEAALGVALAIEPDACADARLAGALVVIAAFGVSGAPAYQLFAPAARAAAVRDALLRAGEGRGLVCAGPEALEILRVEAGTPRLGAELDESVLPDEARLERAVSLTKGCFTGQEVVARVRSRGQVSHLLVGLRLESDALPEPGAVVRAGERGVGEVTSAVRSPAAGAIALAFVRRTHAEPGTELTAGVTPARVVPLPFVEPVAQDA